MPSDSRNHWQALYDPVFFPSPEDHHTRATAFLAFLKKKSTASCWYCLVHKLGKKNRRQALWCVLNKTRAYTGPPFLATRLSRWKLQPIKLCQEEPKERGMQGFMVLLGAPNWDRLRPKKYIAHFDVSLACFLSGRLANRTFWGRSFSTGLHPPDSGTAAKAPRFQQRFPLLNLRQPRIKTQCKVSTVPEWSACQFKQLKAPNQSLSKLVFSICFPHFNCEGTRWSSGEHGKTHKTPWTLKSFVSSRYWHATSKGQREWCCATVVLHVHLFSVIQINSWEPNSKVISKAPRKRR